MPCRTSPAEFRGAEVCVGVRSYAMGILWKSRIFFWISCEIRKNY